MSVERSGPLGVVITFCFPRQGVVDTLGVRHSHPRPPRQAGTATPAGHGGNRRAPHTAHAGMGVSRRSRSQGRADNAAASSPKLGRHRPEVNTRSGPGVSQTYRRRSVPGRM
jgi:hypothetical protein